MKRFVIVGAGAAGLTLAYYLCKAGLPVTVLECEQEVGGLARTFRYDDWYFDIGPHRFFTANPLVLRFLQEVQNKDFIEIPRFSSVYFMDHYHDWPLKLSTVFKLPFSVACRAGLDLIFKARHCDPNSVSFKSYVLQRYGNTLFETFFKDYTEKFVGIPSEETHQNWAKVGVERATIDNTVKTASLMEIFKLMLIPKPAELNFWYPKLGGINTFWKLCAQRITELGGEIITNVRPSKLTYTPNGVQSISYTGQDGQEKALDCEELIWSGPITEVARQLGLSKTELTYRSHVVYNIMLNREPRYRYQWCYYGAKKFVFSRLTNPASFAADTVPKGFGGLCAEVACQQGDAVWNDPERLREAIVNNLLDVRIISQASEIEKIAIERVPNAYPIYHINYIEWLEKISDELKPFANLHLLGRTGRFWYNNMDHSIENAFDVTTKLLSKLNSPSSQAQGVIRELSTK